MPLLIVLFVGSGCAALIYEIVWFQLLSLNLGSSSISLGVLQFPEGVFAGSPETLAEMRTKMRLMSR